MIDRAAIANRMVGSIRMNCGGKKQTGGESQDSPALSDEHFKHLIKIAELDLLQVLRSSQTRLVMVPKQTVPVWHKVTRLNDRRRNELQLRCQQLITLVCLSIGELKELDKMNNRFNCSDGFVAR